MDEMLRKYFEPHEKYTHNSQDNLHTWVTLVNDFSRSK